MASEWIPRLEREQMDEALSAYLAPRVKRLGYLGEWFRCAGHAPEVLLPFLHFTDALKDALPMAVSEAIVLTVATLLDNAYERHQHERLSVRSGFSREWVAQVERIDPDAAGEMSDAQRAAQRYAMAAVQGDGEATRLRFAELAGHFTPAEGMAIVLLVGRYWTHALGVATLGLAPPVPSIFEDGFAG
jgi:alkylhydroperoxidase family enzyme